MKPQARNRPFSCRSASMSYKFMEKRANGRSFRNRGGGNTDTAMNRFNLAFAALLAAQGTAMAASAVNLDSEPRTLIVTEGGSKSELMLAGGETVQFCPSGCFVTMPNGDREALSGAETIEISNGAAKIK